LKDALDRLGPGEIATVKNMLDAKVRQDATSTIGVHAAQNNSYTGTLLSDRPFLPFQGQHIAAEQLGMKHTRPAKDIPNSKHEGEQNTLRTFLADLALLGDNSRIVMVRKISRLGLNSPELLKTYFSAFGIVERVMVSHTTPKSKGRSTERQRMRPAATGFVVMTTCDEAAAMLNHECGTHIINGETICVTAFQSHSI
jgi:hypothetical protein